MIALRKVGFGKSPAGVASRTLAITAALAISTSSPCWRRILAVRRYRDAPLHFPGSRQNKEASMEHLETFLAVIEAGSQTAAARRLGRSLQAVNRSLLALEKSVGVELVRRTTRKSFATEAGLAF